MAEMNVRLALTPPRWARSWLNLWAWLAQSGVTVDEDRILDYVVRDTKFLIDGREARHGTE